jgi:hypothetical protein
MILLTTMITYKNVGVTIEAQSFSGAKYLSMPPSIPNRLQTI